MPKSADIQRVLIIGSGPIVIGQGCEFDYSGTQACRALREEGVAVVLLNSNPATIMTDPELAERTYVEPIRPAVVEEILRRERERGKPIDSLLPTLGGQTALNCAVAVADDGVLERYDVRLIGADRETIRRAEDRGVFVLLDNRMPSRLLGAFPEDVEVQRVGLREAIEQTRMFLRPDQN